MAGRRRSLESMVTETEFWTGRKILLTGHTGFKGGWLTIWLRMLGADVVGYSLPAPTNPSLFETAGVADGITHIIGDVRDFAHLLNVTQSHRPEAIIHMAAQSLVRRSYDEPSETFSTNVMGSVNVLEAARRSECVRAVLIVTSDKCYENKECSRPFRENDALGGHDPYSGSKACAELVADVYGKSFFSKTAHSSSPVALATVRAGNVIGGGDWAEDRLIPDIIRAMVANRPVIIRNPRFVRPWQHVLEPLSGYLLLLRRLLDNDRQFCGPWNFGSQYEDAKEVGWIVEKLAESMENRVSWEVDTGCRPHEAGTLLLDSTKAGDLLGWRSVLRIEEALDWTARWYLNHEKNMDMREITENQIAEYQAISRRRKHD